MIPHRHRYPSLWTPRRVPLGRMELDPNHPLSRGLIVSTVASQPFVNLATSGQETAIHDTSVYTVGVMPGSVGPGYCAVNPAILARTYWSFSKAMSAVADYSVFSWQQLPTASQGGGSPVDGDFSATGGVATRIWQSRIVSGVPQFIAFNSVSPNPSAYTVSGSTLTATQQAAGWTQSCRISASDNIMHLTINGAASGGTATVSGTLAGYNTAKSVGLTLCNYSSATSGATAQPFLGPVFVAHLWARKLSDAEDAWVHAAPFAMLRPVQRILRRAVQTSPPTLRIGPMVSMIY